MIGWQELTDDIEMLHGPKGPAMCRLEIFKLEVTVPSEKKLQELAWLVVKEGFKVNLHTPSFITILGGQNDERVIEARVRDDG